MLKALKNRFPSRTALFGAIALLAMVGATGCQTAKEGDPERGRAIFVEKCGTCHRLAEAATASLQGPDLDSSFAAARAAGMDEDTIAGVVRQQIDRPFDVDANRVDVASVYMPEDIVTGQDADDVARYVASVAGIPGIEPPEAPGGEGGQIFANNGCASCHTFEAAGSMGTVGPNLDESLQGQSAAQVRESIVNPSAEIVSGFADAMPSYEGRISDEDLDKLVEFLLNPPPPEQ